MMNSILLGCLVASLCHMVGKFSDIRGFHDKQI